MNGNPLDSASKRRTFQASHCVCISARPWARPWARPSARPSARRTSRVFSSRSSKCLASTMRYLPSSVMTMATAADAMAIGAELSHMAITVSKRLSASFQRVSLNTTKVVPNRN